VTGRVQCLTPTDSVFIVCDSLLSSDRLVTMSPGQTVCRLLQLDCDSLLSSDRACPVSDSVFIVRDSLLFLRP